MDQQNQEPIVPNNNQAQNAAPNITATPLPSSVPVQKSLTKKVFKIVGIVFGVLVVIFILFVWYGYTLEKKEQSAKLINTSNMNQANQTDNYTENQLDQMLLLKGISAAAFDIF